MAVLTEVLPSVVAEAEILDIAGVDLHTAACTAIALGSQVLLEVSVGCVCVGFHMCVHVYVCVCIHKTMNNLLL